MANKYTYSRTIPTPEGKETFSFEGAASFDEAKKEVDKGVRDRLLEIENNFQPKLPPNDLRDNVKDCKVGDTLNPPTTGDDDGKSQDGN